MNLTVVEQEMMRIWDERHLLTPEIVVEEAAPAVSPLHSFFEWDDSEAARRFRLQQAAGLIRSVKVRVTRTAADGTITDYTIRQFEAASRAGIPDPPPGSYVPVREISGPARTIFLQRMQREMQAMRRRYEGLNEFWAQLDEMMASRGNVA